MKNNIGWCTSTKVVEVKSNIGWCISTKVVEARNNKVGDSLVSLFFVQKGKETQIQIDKFILKGI